MRSHPRSAEYPLDFAGQGKAAADAMDESLSPIRLSPTWLFRPATPLWAYVEQADLTGKDVVLVMTGNSRYKQEEIDGFAARVQGPGGRLVRHLFLGRGRIFWQKSREELLRQVREQLRAAA